VPTATVLDVHRIDVGQRRARLARRHHLAPPDRATDLVRLSSDLVGLHASDPMSVYLAAWARMRDLAVGDLEDALYESRTLLKFLGMRRTMFVVPIDLAAIIDAACSQTIASRERARLLAMLQTAGITGDPERWLAEVEAETVGALEARSEATAAELTKVVPGLREQITFGAGKKWQGRVGVSTRLLFLLANEGRIVRGRPRGGITSSLYRWAPLEHWIGRRLDPWETETAQSELARRWLSAFGPGTFDDLQWWAGWTARETRRALGAVDATEVELERGTGFVLPGDLDAVLDPEPWAALLPALDPTLMGWAARDFFLGNHRSSLFDRNGNAGPTVWWDGRVVGGWAQRPDGEIVYRLLEDVGREAVTAIDAEAAKLRAWLESVRFIPRFRTPLEQELVA
jgi:hypothetical protein